MTDTEKAVFVAVYARHHGETSNAHILACGAVLDLRAARVPETDTSYQAILDDVRGVEDRRCVCGEPLVRNPQITEWGRGYCSVACRDRGRR